jgi:ubiquitin C-terminal hydrolase
MSQTHSINESSTVEEQNHNASENVDPFTKYENLGLSGLANLGNTCFMNSTLQCLSHTYELNEFLSSKSYEKKLNKKSESLLLIEWDKLREMMWSENCVISPGGFVSTVQKIAKIKDKQIFTGFAQNDLPEFLLFIIDGFHNAIKRGVTMTVSGETKNDKDALAVKCYDMMCNMYKNEYSEIITMFYGIHVSQICATDGEVLRQTPEPFFLINLPLPPRKRKCSLLDCFNLYTEPERMDGDNMWYNEETKEKQAIDKQIQFFSLPEILVVDLKRFSNSIRKNNALVNFPLTGLDLSDYVIGYNKYSYVYDLYGVCNHSGSTIGGHYTAFVKNANGKWYFFNDTGVSEIPENKVVSSNAYCLFYRKVPQVQEPDQ